MWRVGIDVGGTFTDLFAWEEETGQSVTAKVLTTKEDRALGVLQVIAQARLPIERITTLIHGSTTATNALIERSYPPAAMVTTEGFRDTIEIGRQRRQHLYDPYQTKPKPIIPRRYRFTVPERLSAQGTVLKPLDEEAARRVADRIAELGLGSVAVAFINAYANPLHEQRMREILQARLPHAYIALSSETRPKFRELGRFMTTAIRAVLLPVMSAYFDRLSTMLAEQGFRGSLFVIKSNGGMMGVELAKQRPEELIESGPAGGVAYAAYLSVRAGFPRAIHTDMGGTSFDTSIVEDGRGLVTREYEVEWEVPVITPMLDIRSVGAGGGSIAWVDQGGALRVGPQSAGADPGPACYGRGGTEATVTDANLLLGRLEPTLGGKFPLDRGAAEEAIVRLGRRVGLDPLRTAEGILRITCENMAQAIKMVLIDRGRDPRDFVLVSFGGAGPMHACFIARALGIPRVVVPAYAGVASAFGATAMDIRHDLETFFYAPVAGVDLARLNYLYEQLEAQGRGLLAQEDLPPDRISLSRSAQMRYIGQSYEVETPIPVGPLTAASLPQIVQNFHDAHRREYGVASAQFAPAFVSLGVTVIGHNDKPPILQRTAASARDPRKGERRVYFAGHWLDTPVYDGQGLRPGLALRGPAIVEYAHSCAVLPPDTAAAVDEWENLIITVG
ncbi:MAG: hydantoinase/oxoprolinase family protein [Candidatus Binatia bacterium]|nr:hydantoinase/oxoprolinase family protein [Candidatus Binatia bacterium]